jgi:membrane-associated phospholipid phosphatase
MARCASVLFGLALVASLPISTAHGAQTADEAASPSFSDGGSSDVAFGIVGRSAVRLANDFGEQVSYPFGLAKRDRSRFVIGTAGIVALVLVDRYTYSPLARPAFVPSDKLIGPAQTLSQIGDGRMVLPLVAGFGAVGLIAGSDREKQTSVMLAEALITSGFWTSAIKYISGRERPRELHEPVSDWTGPSGVLGDDGNGGGHVSFPSGHATGIWAIATVLAHQYPSGHVVPVVAYGTATAISYSRMVLNAHWLSDVVVGGLIGYGCARQVIGAHARTSESESRIHLLYQPTRDEQRVGLAVDF